MMLLAAMCCLALAPMGNLWAQGGDPETIYHDVEEMPEFPGGFDSLVIYLTEHVKYPKADRKYDREGVSHIRFVLEKDGSITNVSVMPGKEGLATMDMHTEAMRVIASMPKWKPGKQRGQYVRCFFTIPIRFKLR